MIIPMIVSLFVHFLNLISFTNEEGIKRKYHHFSQCTARWLHFPISSILIILVNIIYYNKDNLLIRELLKFIRYSYQLDIIISFLF